MLGRLRMPVSDCITAYLDMSQKVFGHARGLTHRERFDPTALEEAVKTVVEAKTGDKDAPLQDISCCKT
jgi:hypothetical protein